MNIEYLSTVVSSLVVLSIASERLVEIVKGLVPFLDTEQADHAKEGKRKACLHILAVASGIFTALLAGEAIEGVLPANLNKTSGIIALGLLASGGSGLWNSILDYTNEVKKIKKKERESN